MLKKRILKGSIILVLILLFYYINSILNDGYEIENYILSFLIGVFISVGILPKANRLKKSICFFFFLLPIIILFFGPGLESSMSFFLVTKFINLFFGFFLVDFLKSKWKIALGIVIIILTNLVIITRLKFYLDAQYSNNYVFDKLCESRLLSRDSTEFRFQEGNIYLINFSFLSCGPCRLKEPLIKELKRKLNQYPNIKIMDVNIETSTEHFSDFKNSNFCQYFDACNLKEKFKIKGYPTDIIIDKRGLLRRKYSAIYQRQKEIYVNETINILKKLNDE